MKRLIFIMVCAALVLAVISCEQKNESADLVLFNGKVVTVSESLPEAQAVAVKGDTISFVGSTEEAKKMIGENTKAIDLKGRLLIPGLIESHAHLRGTGRARMNLNLMTAKSWDEVVFMVASAADKAVPGEWIVGRGWHQEKWDPAPEPNVNGYPLHTALSAATPRNPVILTHASGHAVFANKKAMDLAGVNADTPDPEGGQIVREANGEPIGVFEENAEDLINAAYRKFLNKRTDEQKRADVEKEILSGIDECVSKGITSFHDAGDSFNDVDIIKDLIDLGKIKMRLNLMLGESNEKLRERISDYKIIGYKNHMLNVRSIKRYVDGALGSRGAWLLEPYSDLPGHYGQNVVSIASLTETAKIALENGFQLGIHAIGDRGNREVLNIYERILREAPDSKALRWRIEHAQHLNGADIGRFAELGVIPAMQSIHCTSDAVFVEKRLGYDRAEEGAYVWQKLIKSGAIICNGTDSPVESVDPMPNFYAAVTRKLADGTEFFPEQKMTRMQALKSYTINGAYASFEENIKGSIEVGKLADFTVLSRDIMTIPESQIKNTKAVYTIVGGKVVFEAE